MKKTQNGYKEIHHHFSGKMTTKSCKSTKKRGRMTTKRLAKTTKKTEYHKDKQKWPQRHPKQAKLQAK